MEMYSDISNQSSPSKRLKTLNQSPNSLSFDFKGKSKIEDEESSPEQEEEYEDCCGICLSDAIIGGSGGVSRGFIDSCSHYFCFVCIMEWAKVETKCPLCKRRFSTIRRPTKPPLFTSERVVHVPVRDQVYCCSGNATIGPQDPYSEVKCSVCDSISDENLLLLCDLCDSAAHTYCIGLGATVPEGDWFCHDCTLLRDENTRSETNTEPTFQVRFQDDNKLSSVNRDVPISDIVREPCRNAFQRSRRASSYLPAPNTTDDETSMTSNTNNPSPRRVEKSNARTLLVCHNVRDRIRLLRQNWNGFQNGTLSFSSGQGDDSSISSLSVSRKSEQNQESRLNQQSTVQCSSSNITNGSRKDEIYKAWKMLDRAKSIKKGSEKSAPKFPARKLNAIKEAANVSFRLLYPNCQKIGSKDCPSLEMDYQTLQSAVSQTEKCERLVINTVNNMCKGSIPSNFSTHKKSASSKFTQTPTHGYNASIRSGEKLSVEKSLKRPGCLISAAVSTKGQVKDISSSSKVNDSKEKIQFVSGVGSKQYYDAKSEIQSLVKLNLKLQTKDEKLEADSFKEVARLATHSILAACGLEQQKPDYCSFPDSICSHPIEVSEHQRPASLMPNSCRECFYVYVKDMISSIMLGRKERQKIKDNVSSLTLSII